MFVGDGDGCANASSTMLLFVKKLANCIDNGDSIVIINTNPMNNTTKIYLSKYNVKFLICLLFLY